MTFRDKAPEYDPEGSARIVTIRDLVAKTSIDFDALPTARVDASQMGNCLEEGDILMPARGDYYFARRCTHLSAPTFPTGQINVITPLSSTVDVRYLTWYLNQADAQRFIRSGISGTGIQSLSKAKLLSLPIPIPTLDVQQKIAFLQDLHLERVSLMEELAELNQLELDAICRNLISRESKQ
jgi:hypothetical protein